jgi:hypothetical protein
VAETGSFLRYLGVHEKGAGRGMRVHERKIEFETADRLQRAESMFYSENEVRSVVKPRSIRSVGI